MYDDSEYYKSTCFGSKICGNVVCVPNIYYAVGAYSIVTYSVM